MSIEQASVFLAGSILTMLGFIIVIMGIVVINNIIHKYWKPVRIFHPDSWKGFHPPEYSNKEQVKITPSFEDPPLEAKK